MSGPKFDEYETYDSAENLRLCEQHYAALKLMKAVSKALRELSAEEGNQVKWHTRVDLASALTYARIWFGVSEEEINEH